MVPSPLHVPVLACSASPETGSPEIAGSLRSVSETLSTVLVTTGVVYVFPAVSRMTARNLYEPVESRPVSKVQLSGAHASLTSLLQAVWNVSLPTAAYWTVYPKIPEISSYALPWNSIRPVTSAGNG